MMRGFWRFSGVLLLAVGFSTGCNSERPDVNLPQERGGDSHDVADVPPSTSLPQYKLGLRSQWPDQAFKIAADLNAINPAAGATGAAENFMAVDIVVSPLASDEVEQAFVTGNVDVVILPLREAVALHAKRPAVLVFAFTQPADGNMDQIEVAVQSQTSFDSTNGEYFPSALIRGFLDASQRMPASAHLELEDGAKLVTSAKQAYQLMQSPEFTQALAESMLAGPMNATPGLGTLEVNTTMLRIFADTEKP
jgi:hypothetical protein